MAAPFKGLVRGPPAVLLAAGALVVSAALYALFVARFVGGKKGALTYLAAWHISFAVIGALLSFYAAVRHRSNVGLGLLISSVIALLFYVFFSTS